MRKGEEKKRIGKIHNSGGNFHSILMLF